VILKDSYLFYQQVEGIYGYRRVTLTMDHHRTKNEESQINKK